MFALLVKININSRIIKKLCAICSMNVIYVVFSVFYILFWFYIRTNLPKETIAQGHK
jgi:lipopolysaccharide/colanic/teichoic acid biosynthesis glycosyltransferase